MARSFYVLTDRDREALVGLVRQQYRQTGLHRSGSSTPEDLGTSPDVYAALTPVGGIPARSSNQLGAAECIVYRSIDGQLVALDGVLRTVNNLTTSSIPGETWVKITRDKFGTWYAEPPPSSGATVEAVGCLLIRNTDFSPVVSGEILAPANFLQFDFVSHDTHGFFNSAVPHPTIPDIDGAVLLKVPEGYGGYYVISCNVTWSQHATGIRAVEIYNITTFDSYRPIARISRQAQSVSTVGGDHFNSMQLTAYHYALAGEYFFVNLVHSAGTDLSIISSYTISQIGLPSFWIHRLSA